MSEQNDIALVVLEVWDDTMNQVVHRHRIEGSIPQNDSQRLQFTLEVRGQKSKLADEYPYQRYRVVEGQKQNYAPYLESTHRVTFQ